jgi:hypothetical protein
VGAIFDELVCLLLMGETILRASYLSALWQIYETVYLLFRVQECRFMWSCNSFSRCRAHRALHGEWDTDSLFCPLGPQTQHSYWGSGSSTWLWFLVIKMLSVLSFLESKVIAK